MAKFNPDLVNSGVIQPIWIAQKTRTTLASDSGSVESSTHGIKGTQARSIEYGKARSKGRASGCENRIRGQRKELEKCLGRKGGRLGGEIKGQGQRGGVGWRVPPPKSGLAEMLGWSARRLAP